MPQKTSSPSLVLVGLLAVFAQLSVACPDGYHTFYCNTCPETKCFRFFQEDSIFRTDFTESNSFCSGQGSTFGGEGRLLEFRSSCEFERVKLLVTALDPTAPYLTGLRYDSQGNIYDSVANGAALSSILTGTSLPLTGATENAEKCVAIGRTSMSVTDLIVVDCNASAPSVCGLDASALPVPTIAGDAKRYVGPDGRITLTCEYSSSNNRKGVTWLLNGADVQSVLGDGNEIAVTPTASTLTFTQFNRATHSGSYQCRLEGLLGNLVSRTVDVQPARAPVIESPPMNLTVFEQGLAFFDCFPNLNTVPHPTVQWRYNGVPLDVSDTSKYHVTLRTARLLISVVTASDAGQYSCTLTNIEGSDSSGSGTLTVVAQPVGTPGNPGYFVGPGQDTSTIEVLQGTNLTVECVAETFFSDVRYSWTYESATGGGRLASDLNYPAQDRFGNLVIPDVQVVNSGEFMVLVRLPGLGVNNEPLNANSPRSVNVEVQAIPTVTSITNNQVVALGTNAMLTCTYNGNPSPNVVWFKNGEVVGASTKYAFSTDSSTTHTLTVNNVQPDDLTSYQCQPSNKRGSNVQETFLCGRPGIPGPVNPTVEPFTKDSVRITWDPPAEPNDDIELLSYNVYYEIRNFGQPQTFSIVDRVPEQMGLPWNGRSVQVSGASQQRFIVAYVVAVSAGRVGKVVAEQSYGITYGNTATVPPENVNAVQADDQTVRVSWSAIPSDRQPFVESDITHYEVQYWSVGGAVQEPTNVQTARSKSLAVNLTYQRNNEMVLAARVRGVTQLRREPDSFGFGPWSEVVVSSTVPESTTDPVPPSITFAPGASSGTAGLIVGGVVGGVLALVIVGALVAVLVLGVVLVCRRNTVAAVMKATFKAAPKVEGPPTREEEEAGEKMQANPAYLPIEMMSYESQEHQCINVPPPDAAAVEEHRRTPKVAG